MAKRNVVSKSSVLTPLRLGFFLALRQIQRGNKWTTLLIIFVMMLTFLNLVFIGGILVGLIDGSVKANRQLYTGDIIISALDKKPYIENSPDVLAVARALPWTEALSSRYTGTALVEAGYQTRTNYTDIPNETSATVAGIDPVAENAVSGLSTKVLEGEYLLPGDTESILIGSSLLFQYSPIDAPGLRTLKSVSAGDKVRVTIGNNTKEFTVKGVVKAKVNQIDARVFMLSTSLRDMLGRTDNGVNEIVLTLKPGIDAQVAKQALVASGVGVHAKVQTWEDAQPKAIKDIEGTFTILGNIVGSIGLVVAAITIFIVIFINAITRRKFIGILRGIGVNSLAIEFSYVLQAVFYACIGTTLGVLLLFFVLQPYFAANPINFPFSDGILVATLSGTAVRGFLLMLSSLIAGYIPVKIVLRENTLDAILGR